MNFFLQVHRSIFDFAFYRAVPSLGRRAAVLYLVKLLFITIILSAIAHTAYVYSVSQSPAPAIAAVMKGISIKDGRLHSERPLPYEIPALDLTMIYSRFLNIPSAVDTLQAPRFIVDTSAGLEAKPLVPTIIMRAGDLVFYSAPGRSQIVPYSRKGWYGPINLDFTEPGVRMFLKKAASLIFALNLLWDGLCAAGLVLFCICMLGLAAYIFRIDRQRPIAYFFGIASFAITPISVGMIMIAVAGVRIPGSWQFLIIMAVVVMFRALMATAEGSGSAKDREDRDSGGEQ